MKVYPNLINSVYSILWDIFKLNVQADLAIEKVFKANKKFGSRDRRFVAESVYDIVRNFRLYSVVAGHKKDDFSNEGLNDFLTISMMQRNIQPENFASDEDQLNKYRKKLHHTLFERKVLYSLPDWLDEFGAEQMGQGWDTEMKSQHGQAEVYLRANTLKKSRSELQNLLKAEGFESEIDSAAHSAATALRLSKRGNVFRTEAFKNGYFEVQDGGSQLISEFLSPRPGDRVIDACAGGGGKALHCAAIMKNKGKIIALDTVEWKLLELKKRARRNGVDIIETKVIDGTKLIKRLSGSADKLLLDVPCSGSGVFRRNPDAKWKLTRERIFELVDLQSNILKDYAMLVKPGGEIVFSTCSIFPIENELQIEKFISEHGTAFELVEQKKILTSKTGFDGFYMAKLRRL